MWCAVVLFILPLFIFSHPAELSQALKWQGSSKLQPKLHLLPLAVHLFGFMRGLPNLLQQAI